MVRKLAEATGSITFSMRGEKGESGDTPYVTKTVVDYAITSSVSEKKNWSSTAPDASAAANKGKFLWTRTTYTWSNNKTTENVTYTYIGKDGKDGTSVTIKASKNSTSELPTSGNTLGDGYIIDGYLWVYTGTSKTDSTHVRGFENVGKIQGEPGAAATQYYTHVAWMKDSKGTGFTTTAGGREYAYFGVLVDKNPNAPSAAGDWVKYDWSYVKGATGATGNGIKSTEVTYQIGSSGTTPPTGTWSTSVPNITDANPFLWTRTIFKYTNGTDSKPSFSVATRGTKGALMRQHEGFESGKYKYLSGSGAEAYIDVVCISKKWYQCIQTYETDSPSLDAHWKEMNNYTSIATHLLLAENATINMLGTNQINLFNPATGGKMYGSFRVVDDIDKWSLWLGGETGDSAPYAVKRSGYMKSTAGTIGGFRINESSIGSAEADNYVGAPKMRLYDEFILFNSGRSEEIQTILGTHAEISGAISQMLSLSAKSDDSQIGAYIKLQSKSGTNTFYDKYGLYVSVEGGGRNFAIYGKGNSVLNGWQGGFKYSKMTLSLGSNYYYNGYINLYENNVWFVYCRYADSVLMLPTLSHVREALGISTKDTSTYFSVRITLIADRRSTQSIAVKGRNEDKIGSAQPYKTTEYPEFLNFNANSDYFYIAAGDSMDIMLTYNDSGYYAQLLTLNR